MLSNIKSFLFFVIIISAAFISRAQPTLPEVGAITQDGINILSWINPYEKGVKTIAVQRSADSSYNFTTIGVVNISGNKVQSFVDAHPLLGNNWYRVSLTFNSELEWISSTVKLEVDSMAIANRKLLPTNDSLQKLIAKTGTVSALKDLNAVSYPKSRYVFTNPFTGNINIEIPDVQSNIYSLIFHDQNNKKALEIQRIREPVVILDKHNFQKSGIYQFKLFKNESEFEKGYITIY